MDEEVFYRNRDASIRRQVRRAVLGESLLDKTLTVLICVSVAAIVIGLMERREGVFELALLSAVVVYAVRTVYRNFCYFRAGVQYGQYPSMTDWLHARQPQPALPDIQQELSDLEEEPEPEDDLCPYRTLH